jgi:hypothetical protein
MECGICDDHDVLVWNFDCVTLLLSVEPNQACIGEQRGYAAEFLFEHIMVVTNTTLHWSSLGGYRTYQLPIDVGHDV